ncbi:MAG: hypothetical protein ACOYL8_01800 [Patescibacteria group bacterium]
MSNPFKNLKFLIIALFSAVFFSLPLFASAACTATNKIEFIARDPGGSFIPAVKVEVYKQQLDANGKPKPTTRMASVTASASLGTANLSFKNSLDSDTYVIKVQSIAKDNASYWYYDNVLTCGQGVRIEKTLSGIKFTLRDGDGNLLTNTKFNVYSQLYDSSGKPLKEKKELLTSLSTGYSGQATAYLPQGSIRSLGYALSDHYTIELARTTGKSYYYNIAVSDGKLTSLDYYLSSLKVRLQDISGAAYPNGTAVEIYAQDIDANNQPIKGARLGSFNIGDNGYGTYEINAGIYALAVKGKTGQYQYFYNIEAEEGRVTEHTLVPDQAWAPSSGVCSTASNFNLVLRSYANDSVTGLKFELYEQTTDAYGIPIAGNKVGGGTFNSSGRFTLSLKPDPRKMYAIKIWDKRSDIGEFWFFDALRFVCGSDRTVIKELPILKIILRDMNGALEKNYSFSLYMQKFDADNNPVIETNALVASLRTSNSGSASAYVSPYNTYSNGQTGIYAISAKDANGNTKSFYNIKISPDKDYTFESTFGGLNGEFRDAQEKLLPGRTLYLYEQKSLGGYLSLGQKLFAFKTNNNGAFQFEYPSGTYAITSTDDLGRDNIFWNINVGTSNNYKKLNASLINFSFSTSQSKSMANSASLQLYSLTGKGGTYYRGEQIGTVKLVNNNASLSLAAGAYLASYTGTSNQTFGQAFYAKNGSIYNVNIAPSSKYLVTSKKSFYLPGADSNVASANSSSPVNNDNSSSLSSNISTRLKGKILLQVQDKGQAWYVNPVNGKRYSLGRAEEAYNVMRSVALGVSNANFTAIENNPRAWSQLAGRILLKAEDSGKAYYFDPSNLTLYFLGRPEDAYNVMRTRGLGITTADINKIAIN